MLESSRRDLLMGAATAALLSRTPAAMAITLQQLPAKTEGLPLSAVRLKPSIYSTAVEVNRKYLLDLSADRLLHNFRLYAGLKPKAPIYGGWESETIAGHTLGHYLTALTLMNAQTGCPDCRRRADYIVAELALAQKARGTGYVGAMQRKRKDGTITDGEEIFSEIMRGDIRSSGFDLNGAWSPLYTVHKLFAGLLDVHAAWGNEQAMQVLLGLGNYFERVFAALDDAQMQQMLGCEYGGLNESFAELYARTGDRRWLNIAVRLYDRKVLDPITAGEDILPNLHSNTQIPKIIGLARIHELTGEPAKAAAARFFWETVTKHHSFVIGGNGDREYFFEPDAITTHITEQTCEHCATYNMLKLTQHLADSSPDGALFDYYECAHLNHVMAAHNPRTGGFTYMTPLMTGASRDWSDPKDDPFWCCVGTGMESHSKHGVAIFSQGGDALLVNLYIPSTAHWAKRKATVDIDTRYPFEPDVRLTLMRLERPGRFPIAFRIPAWAGSKTAIRVNGETVTPPLERGYAIVARRWKSGDRIELTLPLDLRIEPAPGDTNMIAILRGPMVLAGDLGPAAPDRKWDKPDPAMVGTNLLSGFAAEDAAHGTYRTTNLVQPSDLRFVPLYSQYERLSATYFRRFTPAEWKVEQTAFLAQQARERDIAARSVDVMHLGEMQAERDHALTSDQSYPVTYRARNGRDARSGGFFEFDMKAHPGPLVLQATYWGDERPRDFDILVDNVKIATQHLGHDHPGEFFSVEYPLPDALTNGKSSLKVRFVPHDGSTVGPVFGVRLFTAKAGAQA
jgi:DUF1680 family protein